MVSLIRMHEFYKLKNMLFCTVVFKPVHSKHVLLLVWEFMHLLYRVCHIQCICIKVDQLDYVSMFAVTIACKFIHFF